MQPAEPRIRPPPTAEELPTRELLKTPRETWALVLALILTIVLSGLALGAWWDSLNGIALNSDQTIAPISPIRIV